MLLGYYWNKIVDRIAELGYGKPTPRRSLQGRDFILEVEEKGRSNVKAAGKIKYVVQDIVDVHAVAYEVTFIAAGGIALLGALACFILVRKTDRVETGPIFSRRSRWLYTMSGRSPAITKQPDPGARHR